MMKKAFNIGLILFLPLLSHTQTLIWVEGVELTVKSSTQVFVEGGINWEDEGKLGNEGDLYLGHSGSGYLPTEADWYQSDAINAGNLLGKEGRVHMLGNMAQQRIWGTDSLCFSRLILSNPTVSEGILSTHQLELQGAYLDLKAFKLYIQNPNPQGIQTFNGGAIKGDTYIGQEGAYTRVIWIMDSISIEKEFVVPFLSAEGERIPMGFVLQEYVGDPVELFTYPTNPLNEPYPIQLGTVGNVDHLFNALGRDFSSYFIDRYWYINAGNNLLSGLSLSYGENDVSESVLDKDQELKGQWWNGGKWTFFNLGEPSSERRISWTSPFTFSGIWSLSRDQLAVSKPAELPVEHLSIYPNPTKGLCFISLEFPYPSETFFRLFNSSGQIVLEEHSPIPQKNHLIQLDLSSLSGGIYDLQILSQGKRISRKIMRY